MSQSRISNHAAGVRNFDTDDIPKFTIPVREDAPWELIVGTTASFHRLRKDSTFNHGFGEDGTDEVKSEEAFINQQNLYQHEDPTWSDWAAPQPIPEHDWSGDLGTHNEGKKSWAHVAVKQPVNDLSGLNDWGLGRAFGEDSQGLRSRVLAWQRTAFRCGLEPLCNGSSGMYEFVGESAAAVGSNRPVEKLPQKALSEVNILLPAETSMGGIPDEIAPPQTPDKVDLTAPVKILGKPKSQDAAPRDFSAPIKTTIPTRTSNGPSYNNTAPRHPGRESRFSHLTSSHWEQACTVNNIPTTPRAYNTSRPNNPMPKEIMSHEYPSNQHSTSHNSIALTHRFNIAPPTAPRAYRSSRNFNQTPKRYGFQSSAATRNVNGTWRRDNSTVQSNAETRYFSSAPV